jgi:hypothetical protein
MLTFATPMYRLSNETIQTSWLYFFEGRRRYGDVSIFGNITLNVRMIDK